MLQSVLFFLPGSFVKVTTPTFGTHATPGHGADIEDTEWDPDLVCLGLAGPLAGMRAQAGSSLTASFKLPQQIDSSFHLARKEAGAYFNRLAHQLAERGLSVTPQLATLSSLSGESRARVSFSPEPEGATTCIACSRRPWRRR